MGLSAFNLCLVLLWILLIPGLILTHIAIGNLVGPAADLPQNVADGFNSVFKFDSLKADSEKLQNTSLTAMSKCNYNPRDQGGACVNFPNSAEVADTTTQRNVILAIFGSTMATVEAVTNDKYFGISDFNSTAASLSTIKQEMAQVNGSMPCIAAVPSYCKVWESAGSLVEGQSQISSAIDSFKNQADELEKYVGFLSLLHFLPYLAVIALGSYTCFHWKGCACCCCCCPFILFWFLSFVVYLSVVVVGFVVVAYQESINLSALKGNPTVKQTIDHVQTKFPEFWNVVFADLESALGSLLTAAWVFTIFNILLIIYSVLDCCFGSKKDEDEEEFEDEDEDEEEEEDEDEDFEDEDAFEELDGLMQ